MFTVHGVGEGGLGNALNRSWSRFGSVVWAGGCTRSLLVLLSTEHQPSVRTLKTKVASAWVGMIPEWNPLSLRGQLEGRIAPRGNWKNRVCPENQGGAEAGFQRDAGPEWSSLRVGDASGRPRGLSETVAGPSSQGWEGWGRVGWGGAGRSRPAQA